MQRQLVQLLNRGGFELRKWSSNCPSFLENVPKEHLEVPLSLSSKDDPIFKVLGLQWDPTCDCFSFDIRPPVNIEYSKRAVLSTIARIYDPLGFLSPVVFYAKHLLQELWQFKLDWDEMLPPSIKETWSRFVKSLPTLSEVSIPRHILPPDRESCQILGFCDASQKGYAASIYLRTLNKSGQHTLHLLKAKTKLAPLKTISVPRLELCGALLLSRLLQSIQTFCNGININRVFLFTDSTIVLCWLSTSPHLLKTFVGNRVTTILQLTSSNNCSWHHVSTTQNPSDCASRGLTPQEFVNSSLWWKGPSWASQLIDSWPIDLEEAPPDQVPDLKSETPVCLVTTSSSCTDLVEGMNKISSFSKLQRVWAYVLRFVKILKNPHSKHICGLLLCDELLSATHICIKLVQNIYFYDEYSHINSLSCSKPLARLTPFQDANGLIRVGGRLRNEELLPYFSPTKKRKLLSSLIFVLSEVFYF